MTEKDAKRMLSRLGFKLGISPRLISIKLLDAYDKADLLNDGINDLDLENHVKVWIENGQQDCINRYKPRELVLNVPQNEQKPRYRRPFIDYQYKDS